MAYGRVIKMENRWRFKTPNSGTLVDIDTGIIYPFKRPSITAQVEKGPKWNVEKYDVVSFTIEDGNATNVTLYKKYQKGKRITKINT